MGRKPKLDDPAERRKEYLGKKRKNAAKANAIKAAKRILVRNNDMEAFYKRQEEELMHEKPRIVVVGRS